MFSDLYRDSLPHYSLRDSEDKIMIFKVKINLNEKNWTISSNHSAEKHLKQLCIQVLLFFTSSLLIHCWHLLGKLYRDYYYCRGGIDFLLQELHFFSFPFHQRAPSPPPFTQKRGYTGQNDHLVRGLTGGPGNLNCWRP